MTAIVQPRMYAPLRVMALCLTAMLFPVQVYAAGSADVQSARPWRYRVFADKLPAVDGIVVRRDGGVYATQGLTERKGRVVYLHGGRVEVIANNLERPSGLLISKYLLYVAEQIDNGRVTEISLLNNNNRRVVENLSNPQHIARLPDGDLVVTENGVSGRLVRLLSNGAIEVVTSGLNSPEGLSVARDGTIYIGESGTGRVLAFKDGVLDVVIDDLDELGQIEAALDGTLWISEQGSLGRLLRLKDGALETVLSGLKDPRGIALMENGAVLVAEQGRARILLVEPRP
jgi:hypothetical protein